MLDAYLARLRGAASTGVGSPRVLLSALAWWLADALESRVDTPASVEPVGLLADRPEVADQLPCPPAALLGPDLLGAAHEALLDPAQKHRHGVFYTPPMVASGLVDIAVEGWDSLPPTGAVRICDPSCGGGAFLMAAARWLESRGLDRGLIVDELLWGVDLDPLAVDVCRTALVLWAAEAGRTVEAANVVVADTLAAGRSSWVGPVTAFDLVVGNPPFQNQLGAATARSPGETAMLRERLGDAAGGYADAAAVFVVAALDLVRDGGRLALILPESFLGARDTGAARGRVLADGDVVGFWSADEPLFRASVRVCAPIIERGARVGGPIPRWRGGAFRPTAPAAIETAAVGGEVTWGTLLGDRFGAPNVHLLSTRVLGSLVTATAGFRDQFYGVAPYVFDDRGGPVGAVDEHTAPRLITSGLIEPAHTLWGRRATRFAGSRWQAPRVDLDELGRHDGQLARWAEARLVPKVVLASQTRVLEAAVDESGTWWPSVPVVAITALPDDLWLVAAVLLAPPVTAWSAVRFAGTALSGDAVKLAARHVLEVPLPADEVAWNRAAVEVGQATLAADAGDAGAWRDHLVAAADAMCVAYDVDRSLATWWEGRLPQFRADDVVPSSAP